MKIVFLIPSKDGGEGFERLLDSIDQNIDFAKQSGIIFEVSIIFIINGKPGKPLRYLERFNGRKNTEVLVVDFLGKTRAINWALKRTTSDLVVILDDDVFFNTHIIAQAIKVLKQDRRLQIVGFKNAAAPYNGGNMLKRISYDVINIRSLKDLYKGTDPFLFGRLLVARRSALIIPDNIINEDLYLSIINNGNYQILQEKVFYEGECSIKKHIKRVLRIEAGRKQVRDILGSKYDEAIKKTRREIDRKQFHSISLYYKICYYCYCLLRFFTNTLIPKFISHKTNYW